MKAKGIVIIGASSGLGERIARIYIERGWRVGVAARRIEALESLRALAPKRVVSKRLDVTAEDAAEGLLALIQEIGGADIVFNVAGVGFANPSLEPTKDRQIAMTNCLGFTAIMDAAFNYLADRPEGGRIAAISSVAGTKGLGVAAAYSASKSYQSTYLTALRQLATIRRKDVKITDIRPGFIDTDLLNKDVHYPMLMNPNAAARKIVKAVDSGRRVAVIDWRWGILVALWRLIPRWIWDRLPVKTS